jgi:hypothetical protein
LIQINPARASQEYYSVVATQESAMSRVVLGEGYTFGGAASGGSQHAFLAGVAHTGYNFLLSLQCDGRKLRVREKTSRNRGRL